MSSAPRLPVDRLAWDDRLVRALPGDPEPRNFVRQVTGAAYSRVAPTPVPDPQILALVPDVAALLDLDPEPRRAVAEVLGGNRVLAGMAPYAACYGGHQFGQWAGQLGDGRAITLGEVKNARGEHWEVQLKGAGPTPYSRRADGRAVLRSSLRELVCSEAMFHLGVPTTRALSLVGTGQPVLRDLLYDGHPALEPGAIVCRVAPSFLRFGNYELHASRGDSDTLRKLLRFTVQTYFPEHLHGDELDLPGFLTAVCHSTARLVVEWLRVGFVHGVMNTDNMSILGLTIDYGPYGWIDSFDPDWTPNTTDAAHRRYRFGHQPQIAHWNLLMFAQALASLSENAAPLEDALNDFRPTFARAYRDMMLGKLGFESRAELEHQDAGLIDGVLSTLKSAETDMTLFYRALADIAPDEEPHTILRGLEPAFYAPRDLTDAQRKGFVDWFGGYAARIRGVGLSEDDRRRRMNAVNPLYVPRNYLAQEAIDATHAGDDGVALSRLMDVLRTPYTAQPGREAYAARRPDWARSKPGCSMLSCSS